MMTIPMVLSPLGATIQHFGHFGLSGAVEKLGLKGALVNGTTDGRFLDDPIFEPLLACTERLGSPIDIHPNTPPDAVTQAYYSGLPDPFGFVLSTYCFGWSRSPPNSIARKLRWS